MKTPPADRPILSRYVDIGRLPDRGLDVLLAPDVATRTALAAFNGLEAVLDFAADLHVEKRGSSGAHVSGTLKARVTQICVVSLDPFDTDISEPVDVDYQSGEGGSRLSAPDVLAPGDRDPPDLIVDGRIDVGALAAEIFSLSLDPYPKKPGVTFAEPEGEVRDPSPFAVLGRLKDPS